MSDDDRTFDEMVAGLTRALPSMAVVIWRDGEMYRAALRDKPQDVDSTPCTETPTDAVTRILARHIVDARKRVDAAQEHLSKLRTRIIRKTDPWARKLIPSGDVFWCDKWYGHIAKIAKAAHEADKAWFEWNDRLYHVEPDDDGILNWKDLGLISEQVEPRTSSHNPNRDES